MKITGVPMDRDWLAYPCTWGMRFRQDVPLRCLGESGEFINRMVRGKKRKKMLPSGELCPSRSPSPPPSSRLCPAIWKCGSLRSMLQLYYSTVLYNKNMINNPHGKKRPDRFPSEPFPMHGHESRLQHDTGYSRESRLTTR
jgi:hypothetical protein